MGHEYLSEVSGCNGRYRRKGILDVNRIIREARPTDMAEIMKVMDFCFSKDSNIRIDTHGDNHIMQHVIKKYGFTYCGIIYLASGDERLAYQLIKE
jgi:hypothetical protein